MALSNDRKDIPQVFQVPQVPPTHTPMAAQLPSSHGWRTVDDHELAADFDGSLSGLGMELAGIQYNMRYGWYLHCITDIGHAS